MSVGKVGDPIRSEFSLYEVDGTTLRSGASGDVSVILLRDGGVSAEVVSLAEVAGKPGQYVASLTPLSAGKYTLILRDTVYSRDLVESFDVSLSSLDDVAAAVQLLNSATVDALVSVEGIDVVRAGDPWAPLLVFLRRSTMTLIDPDVDLGGDPIVQVEVLSTDGTTVLQTVLGSALTRESLGKYLTPTDPVASAGICFLRVTFTTGGKEVIDIVRVTISPALGAASGVLGTAASLARIYTYPTSLLNAKFDLTPYAADEVWRMIQDVSAELETLTRGNLFNGEYGDYNCSGRARRMVYHPLQHPFCFVDSIQLVDDLTDHRRDGFYRLMYYTHSNPTVETKDFSLRAGMVESIRKAFPMGANNVVVTGAIGMLRPAHRQETTSASVISSASNSVVVADLTGFQVRDVLDIIGATGAVRVIVRAIDLGTSSLLFDAVGGSISPIEIGAVVRTFGQVPRPVEMVANYLFGVKMRELSANASGDEFIPAGRVRREKTDDYEIEFQPGKAGDSLTGSPKYDQMLVPYLKTIDVRVP